MTMVIGPMPMALYYYVTMTGMDTQEVKTVSLYLIILCDITMFRENIGVRILYKNNIYIVLTAIP